MRNLMIPLLTVALAGCATQSPVAMLAPPMPAKPLVREAAPTREVETRYEVGTYLDADDPSVRHEAHVVYRLTRVPARVTALETIPRTEFAPASYAPLPASAELAAELATQRQITTDLRAIKASMAKMEAQAQNQFGALVDQTAQTVNVRRQLEDERARTNGIGPTNPPVDPGSPALSTTAAKW